LPYLKGGAAWVHSKHQSDFVGFGTFTSAYNSAQGAAAGWLLGAGIEGTLFSNWSWNVEYNYISLGPNSFALTCNVGAFCFPLGGVGIAIQQPIAQEIQLVKVGVNYRFGWPL
jgi:opacity protein-like surface antigen